MIGPQEGVYNHEGAPDETAGEAWVPRGVALNAGTILRGFASEARERIARLEVLETVDSTNAVLLSRSAVAPGACEVLLAEQQSAGRGQRGRSWLTRPGGAICLSLSWSFARKPQDLSALSLAIGVCVVRALAELPVLNLGLKWPNDVLAGGRKLGGILTEVRTEQSGSTYAVVGVGLNVKLEADLAMQIASTGIEPVDLQNFVTSTIDRNAVAARVVSESVTGLALFEREGLRPFADEWQRMDALRGRDVTVRSAEETIRGVARGIDLSGAFLLETPQSLRSFVTGEVTVRATV